MMFDSSDSETERTTPQNMEGQGSCTCYEIERPKWHTSTKGIQAVVALRPHVHTDAEIIFFIRANLGKLNKSKGITSLLSPYYDKKRSNVYSNWMFQYS